MGAMVPLALWDVGANTSWKLEYYHGLFLLSNKIVAPQANPRLQACTIRRINMKFTSTQPQLAS